MEQESPSELEVQTRKRLLPEGGEFISAPKKEIKNAEEMKALHLVILRDWVFNKMQILLEASNEAIETKTPLSLENPLIQEILADDINNVLDESEPLYAKTYRELVGKIHPEVVKAIDRIKLRIVKITELEDPTLQQQAFTDIITKTKGIH